MVTQHSPIYRVYLSSLLKIDFGSTDYAVGAQRISAKNVAWNFV